MIHKIWKYIRFIAVPLICVLVCCLIYSIIDTLSMGFIADWFYKTFAYETYSYLEYETIITRSYDWNLIKAYFLQFFIIIAALISLLGMIISNYKKRKHKRENAHTIAEYMNRYILENTPLPVETPQEYTEIFAQISKIRYEIQSKEQKLRTETERKNDLVTYLAHDLKTPLTSVIGYMTLLRDEPDISEELRSRYTEISLKKAERLEELINELFEITRFNISKIELQKESVNLSLMLEQIVYEFRPLLKDKELRFSTQIEPDIQIYCDVDKMERIIDNLIRNAISYSYPNTELQITLESDAANVTLTFINSGKTIPKEKLERIFEQFFRLDSSRSSSTGGSGLGLAISKQLAEAHGGAISAESSDEIIRFTVKLPLDRKKIV